MAEMVRLNTDMFVVLTLMVVAVAMVSLFLAVLDLLGYLEAVVVIMQAYPFAMRSSFIVLLLYVHFQRHLGAVVPAPLPVLQRDCVVGADQRARGARCQQLPVVGNHGDVHNDERGRFLP